MQSKVELFAQFIDYSWRVSSVDKIKDEQEAVALCLKNRCRAFSTYEVTSVELNGKRLAGEPENFSARRHVGIDRLYTRDEVIAIRQNEPLHSNPHIADIQKDARTSVIRHLLSQPANIPYIISDSMPGRGDEFSPLAAGEKAYDRAGKLLWPLAPTAPGTTPGATDAAAPKP